MNSFDTNRQSRQNLPSPSLPFTENVSFSEQTANPRDRQGYNRRWTTDGGLSWRCTSWARRLRWDPALGFVCLVWQEWRIHMNNMWWKPICIIWVQMRLGRRCNGICLSSQEAAQIHDLLEHNITHLSLGWRLFRWSGSVWDPQVQRPCLQPPFFEGTSFWTGGFFASSDGTCTQKVFLVSTTQSHCRPRVIPYKMEQLYGKVAFKPMSEHFVRWATKASEHHSRLQQRWPPARSPNVQRRCIFTAMARRTLTWNAQGRFCLRCIPSHAYYLAGRYDHCERMTSDSAAYGQMLREFVV